MLVRVIEHIEIIVIEGFARGDLAGRTLCSWTKMKRLILVPGGFLVAGVAVERGASRAGAICALNSRPIHREATRPGARAHRISILYLRWFYFYKFAANTGPADPSRPNNSYQSLIGPDSFVQLRNQTDGYIRRPRTLTEGSQLTRAGAPFL
jgi:hypothetical protein